jgi:hypothetical protein
VTVGRLAGACTKMRPLRGMAQLPRAGPGRSGRRSALCGRKTNTFVGVIWPMQGRVRLCSMARVEEGSTALVPSLGEITVNSPRFPWSETS